MHNNRMIYITARDMERLRQTVQQIMARHDDIRGLSAELDRACVVAANDVPADVVTMNSRVRLRDLTNGEEMTYTLVFPELANVEQDRISVLAPIGTAMLGQRVGDVIEWQVPDGLVKLQVVEVLYQPEAHVNVTTPTSN